MIHYLKIQNFRSIRKQVTFSFEATKEQKLRKLYVRKQAGIPLLRLGLIYGANASGKSNILEAFYFLINFILNIPQDKNQGTGVIPFYLDEQSRNMESKFEFSFIVKEKRYLLKLSLDREKITEESLYIYNTQKPTKIYERTFANGKSMISFSKSIDGISKVMEEEINIKCLINMSVISAYNQVNGSIPYLEDVYKWLKQTFFQPITNQADLLNFAKIRLIENEDLQNKIVEILHKADFNINKINVKKQDLKEEELERFVTLNNAITGKFLDKEYVRNNIANYSADFLHICKDANGKYMGYSLDERLESTGTKRMLGLSAVLETLSTNETVLLIDEIESSMHPKLTEYLLSEFLKIDSSSQILATTHYDGLLDEDDLIRKDVVWFTNKDSQGVTDLYCLSDFKDVKRLTSWRKAYRNGLFSAQPNI